MKKMKSGMKMDMAMDKKKGIKEGSAKDIIIDMKLKGKGKPSAKKSK